MSTYVSNQLTRYNHPHPKRFQRTPYAPAPTIFGRGAQDLPEPDCSPLLDAMGNLRVQQVVGSFLYYGRAVDLTILASISEIASQQAAPTENTMKKVNHFLDYMACNPRAVSRFYVTDMVLNYHSDASYLTVPNAPSRAGGAFFPWIHPPR